MRAIGARRPAALLLGLFASVIGAGSLAADDRKPAPATWPTDVRAAFEQARANGRLVLVYVSEPPAT